MKKTISIPIYCFSLAVILITFLGCKEKTAKDGLVTSPSAFFQQNLENAKQKFIIDPTIYNSLQGSQGTLVQISPNSLVDAQGNLVTSEVTVEFISVFDRTSMLMLGKNTQGMRSLGVVQTMVTGGEYYLNAHASGNQVFLNQDIAVSVPVNNGGSGPWNMRKFDGGEALDGNPIWELAADSLIPVDTIQIMEQWQAAYELLENDWGWTNIDRWYNDPRPKTQLYVQVPEEYDNSNCEVFLSYDGEPNALANFDVWDSEQEMFTEHYGQVPIGLECHFIAVTIIDEVLHYAIQGNTIEEDHVEVIEDWTPTTQAELADLIDALP